MNQALPFIFPMAGAPVLFSCIFFFLLRSSFAQSQEQEVLLQLRSHWENPTSLSTWNTSTSHCSWSGVTCANNSVTNITLRNDPTIAGDVPSFVCNLTNLSVLDLYNDSINNTFPDLSSCRSLTHLNLGQNDLVGTLPDDIGAILSKKLVHLDLDANNFYGDIPKSISNFSSLLVLDLYSNRFNGTFPAEIGSISNLEELRLAYNPFVPSRLPQEFGGLTKLKYLWMTNTSLIGEIPESFEKLVGLEHLDLKTNGLTRIPDGMWSLPNLQLMYLFQNNLYGEIPAKIGATRLVEIDVSSNQLNGRIPEDLGKLQNLKTIFLWQNNFSGEIPVGIASITTLDDIRLYRNKLTGTLPPDLGKHSKLYNLEVSENKLIGELPRRLCEAGVLNSLIVFDNNLTGTVPESLGSCSSLVDVELYDNRFSGEVPLRIWSLTDLSVVMVKDNDLSGELPDVLPWNLTRLEISNNRFSGRIPSQAENLKVFHGSSNEFSGELPSNMSGVSNLQELLLDNNKLSGAIPASIEKLESLTNLDLSSNQLTGEIPATIGSLPVLTLLDLSSNQLSGAIPNNMGNLKLNKLNLSSNSLTGTVPWQLENAAYNESFLSNPGLCSLNQSIINLPSCASQSKKSELSKGLLALFITLGIVVFFAAAVFGLFAVKGLRRRSGTGDDLSKWRFTSFSLLSFTEANIISDLAPENLIGSGASGQVYKITVAGETLAVKKISNNKRLDTELEKEFQAEVEILGSIRHLNIVKLLCCISSPDSKLLVYDYLKNGSLDQWLQKKRTTISMGSGRECRGRLDWPVRMAIAVGAARGLSYMHHECNPPIVHRDVKSSNILLDAEFRPKVADFGLARILANSDEPEIVSSFAGSFGYMAPECAYTNRVNEKVDVYGFGVVLLELTTGKKASDGGANSSLAEWTWRHFQDGGSAVEIVDEDVRDPKWLEEISMVMRLALICTGPQPSSRPTMEDVRRVLLKYSGEHGAGDDDGRDFVADVPLLKKGSRRSKSVRDDDEDDSGPSFNV